MTTSGTATSLDYGVKNFWLIAGVACVGRQDGLGRVGLFHSAECAYTSTEVRP